MTRIATGDGWRSALLDLMAAQARQNSAQERFTTGKKAEDLKGFGRGAESLTAMRGLQDRVRSYIEAGEAAAARLETQSLALDQLADAAKNTRQAILDALANDSADGLMIEIRSQFAQARTALNTQHNDRYLFAGARVDQAPVLVADLVALAAAPTIASAFGNDQLKAVSRVSEGAAIETGFLADQLATGLFTEFAAVQTFDAGANGPFGKPLTAAQRTFLQGQVQALGAVYEGLVGAGAANGTAQNRVDAALEAQRTQEISLIKLVSERVDVDMAKALTELQQSQMAVQASTHVISQLRGLSLIDLLK